MRSSRNYGRRISKTISPGRSAPDVHYTAGTTSEGVMAKNTVFCPGHTELSSTLARVEERLIAVDKRINGSIESIEKHIEHGGKWRLSIIGVAVTLVLAVIGWVYAYGQIAKQVEVNTDKWAKHEDIRVLLKEQLDQLRIEVRNPQVYKAR